MGPSETKPNPENCKYCSSKRAYDTALKFHAKLLHLDLYCPDWLITNMVFFVNRMRSRRSLVRGRKRRSKVGIMVFTFPRLITEHPVHCTMPSINLHHNYTKHPASRKALWKLPFPRWRFQLVITGSQLGIALLYSPADVTMQTNVYSPKKSFVLLRRQTLLAVAVL